MNKNQGLLLADISYCRQRARRNSKPLSLLLIWLVFLIPAFGEATDFTDYPYSPYAQLYSDANAAEAACQAAQAALPVTGFYNWVNGEAFSKTECDLTSHLLDPPNLVGLCPHGLGLPWAFRIDYCPLEGTCGSLNFGVTWQYFVHCADGTPHCPEGQSWNQTTQQCEGPPPPPPDCKAGNSTAIGNPCDPATGNKYLPAETDSAGTATGRPLIRAYNSQLYQDLGFGFGWSAPGAGRLKIYDTTVHVIEASGRGEVYTCPSAGGACTGNADSAIALARDASGSRSAGVTAR